MKKLQKNALTCNPEYKTNEYCTKKTLLNSCDYCLPQILWLLKCKI